MNNLKMLGLAAIAAAAVMAFVGAGTASADELCTTQAVSNMCPEGRLLSTIEATQNATGVLETTGGTTLIDCKGGDIHIKITKQGTAVKTIEGNVEKLQFTECSGTVTTIKPGTLKLVRAGEEAGTFTSVGAEVTTGILGTTCTYGSGEGTDLGTSANIGLVVNTIVKLTAGGFLCPKEARWTAEFKITNHNTVVWISN